jgi:hypothetical protein
MGEIVRSQDASRLFLAKPLTHTCSDSQETRSQEQHARWFRDFTGTKSNLSHILKRRTVNCRQTDGRNELTIDRRYGEEVLAVGVNSEIIFEKSTIDVDSLDVDYD